MLSNADRSVRVLAALRRWSRWATVARAGLDIVAWAGALLLGVVLRLDLTLDHTAISGYWKILTVVIPLQIVFGYATGLYRRRWLYGSFDEVAALAGTVALTTVALFLLNGFYFSPRQAPQSAVLVGGVIGTMFMAGVRYVSRLFTERLRRPGSEGVERLLVYGAGEGGRQAITTLLRSPESPYLPVGLLDDDPAKKRLTIMGVPMLGTRDDMRAAAEKTEATGLLIALPSADAEAVRPLVDLALDAGLSAKILPSVGELFGGSIGVADIRDVSDEDLLGRHKIDTDVDSIAQYVRGRRVLVTGAGGSIGSELCRQLYAYGPKELIMLDRDESALHQVELSIHGRALLDTDETVLVDIRDSAAVMDAFKARLPEVVFHAAALKHLPMLQRFPEEGYKTNVVGSLNVLRAAEAVGVSVFVNISTDKAANPTSVLGHSKRAAERLTTFIGEQADGGSSYLSVRFGNVLGSRGSVLTSFREQILAGGPVTVTHRDVTRFFMTIPEAVQLVIQAGAIGKTGEVLVLDMGKPVRIYDLARRLVAQSRRPIDIEVTGLRPGEKLHEDLFGTGEVDSRPRHPLISHATVDPLDPLDLPDDPVDIVEFVTGRR